MSTTSSEVDVIVLGRGPAGLQAAVHAGRAGASVAVLGRPDRSALAEAQVENYCCEDRVLSGRAVLTDGARQAERFGARFVPQDAVAIMRTVEGRFRVRVESGESMVSGSLVIATGAPRRELGVPGERQLAGKGVSYCVDCDAGFFRGSDVIVVGGGSAAVSGALALRCLCADAPRLVHLVYERLEVDQALADEVSSSELRLYPGRRVTRIRGTDQVEGVELDDGGAIDAGAVFVELGAKSVPELFGSLGLALEGTRSLSVATDRNQQTNVPGVFAAGDVCGPPWQMAKAVGEGCVAGIEAAAHARTAGRA